MKAHLLAFWERLRASFWFVPALLTGVAMLLALLALALDETVGYAAIEEAGWLYTGGPEGARTLLSTVAGSVITVAMETIGRIAAHAERPKLLAALRHTAQLIAQSSQEGLPDADSRQQVLRCYQAVLPLIDSRLMLREVQVDGANHRGRGRQVPSQ